VKAVESIEVPNPATFPAPLVLPDNDLAFDPTYPAQSFRSWLREKDRNEVTPERRIIYIARPPDLNSEVEFMKDDDTALESAPKLARSRVAPATSKAKSRAKSSMSKATIPAHIALNTSTDAVRIRTRPLSATDPFPAQLNLNDVLDAAIAILPDDAYSLLLLVE
jgi:archaemetzincin